MQNLDFKKIYEEEHLTNGLSYSKIREKYNIPRGTWDYYIRYKLKLECDLRKYRVKDDFFDEIDSELKAYLLGFLYADGYLASDGRIGMRLNIKDIEIIKLIQEHICPNNPIEYSNNQNIKRCPQVSIRFLSKNIYKNLLKLGFNVDKTHVETDIFSHIPEDFKIPFIRGFTDGDGCVCCSYSVKGKYYRKSLAYSNGTKQILEDIDKYFGYRGTLRSATTYWTLRYDKIKIAVELANLIYKDSKYFLKRKKMIVEKINNLCNNTELI